MYINNASLVSFERVGHVSKGLHCNGIAFQFSYNGSVRPKSDSVKREKQNLSNCISVFEQVKYMTY